MYYELFLNIDMIINICIVYVNIPNIFDISSFLSNIGSFFSLYNPAKNDTNIAHIPDVLII